MKILFTTQALSIGGIEVLALRLSEAFAKIGHDVILYDFNPDRSSSTLVSHYATETFRIEGLKPSTILNKLLWKTHALLFRFGLYKEFRPKLIERHFAMLLKREHPDVVCSLSFHQDYLSCIYGSRLGIPIVISMHGTYEYAAPEWPERARYIYEHVQAIIYAADKNMSWYQNQPYMRPKLPVYKIYTGADLAEPIAGTIKRAHLGLSENDFVYIMVARGIRQKGWLEVIKAFRQVKEHHAEAALLLVGEGEALDILRQQFAMEPGVIFYGNHPNSLELTALANVGLLPSYFSIETLPNVIIDYLRCHLPVVASDIGEIPNMLTLPDGRIAGRILQRISIDQGVDVPQLRLEMERLLNDTKYYQDLVTCAAEASKRFDLNDCIAQYTKVFEQVLIK